MEEKYILDYCLAGKAIFTLISHKKDQRYTYKILRDKGHRYRYFVYTLYGEDNTKDYRFLCYFYSDNVHKMFKTRKDMASRMLFMFLCILQDDKPLPASCEFLPSGKCGKCGRLLTTPESIKCGLGPHCRGGNKI